MGDRYFITIECPICKLIHKDIYYAPTCGFIEHICKCGHITDLIKYTGISYEDASNEKEICMKINSL